MNNTAEIKKRQVIIYTRISIEEQKNARVPSLSYQEERLKQHCRSNNFEIVAHFQDVCLGKDFDRPEFQKMLMKIRSGALKANLFLATTSDRFARSKKLGLDMIAELRNYGIHSDIISP